MIVKLELLKCNPCVACVLDSTVIKLISSWSCQPMSVDSRATHNVCQLIGPTTKNSESFDGIKQEEDKRECLNKNICSPGVAVLKGQLFLQRQPRSHKWQDADRALLFAFAFMTQSRESEVQALTMSEAGVPRDFLHAFAEQGPSAKLRPACDTELGAPNQD